MPSTPKLTDLGAFVALLRAQAIPADRLAGMALEVGSAVALLEMVRSGELESMRGELPLGLFDDRALRASSTDAQAWVDAGYDVRTVFDPTYPANLRDVVNKPPFVFIRGEWNDSRDSRAVSIVGTRQASPEGLKRTQRLATAAAKAGVTVVSGLARGIDTAAHTAAIAAGGRTTAVLGTGIDLMYPPENAALAERIASGSGALLSQFFPAQPPAKWTFPKRNVVMSGLTWATVVIEASWTSGARVQATAALRHGRTVFLLKSLVDSHEWARGYVTEGKFGVRARELATIDDLIDALSLEPAAA